jgi:Na+/proline symporter
MSPTVVMTCIVCYFAMLLVIAWRTGRHAGNAAYFLGNKASPWWAVAFGLIGDSLSGVTFISVPGQVGTAQFSYLQMVFGYVLGYVVIAEVLLPLYYRLNLTSIYTYLLERLGPNAQRMGSLFFLLSRTVGAAARLFLAAGVLHQFVFAAWGIPFWLTVAIIIVLMLLYTYQGGIRTLVWTDTFQSAFLLLGLIISVIIIAQSVGDDAWRGATRAGQSLSQIFFWDWKEDRYFWKQLVGGAFVAICMTGLDQNMMQKNLSCRSLREAKRNIRWFSVAVVLVNLLFLWLGALLYQYAAVKQVALPARADHLFPMLALQHLGWAAGLVFIIGLTAATFSSADSVLTTLTTSFCVDLLRMDREEGWTDARRTRVRHVVHIGFAILLLVVILLFYRFTSDSVISLILKLANYTYGPLLGLFAFSLVTRRPVKNAWVPMICLWPPVFCWGLESQSIAWFSGYRFGNELLIINGLLTFGGLWLSSFFVRR